MVANIAEILKDSFASLSQSMSEGFDNLGQMFQGSPSACMSHESRLIDDLSSVDSEVSEVEEPAAKRPKSDEAGQSTENELILGQLEKDFDLAEHKVAEINTNLAAIVSKLLKEKTEEDKLTEIEKRYPAPKNCDRLAETRVNLAIWNNLSEKARTADIKLQKVQKSFVKGATAVVSVVNNLITASGMPSKNEVVNNLMDGMLLLANANMELNVRRREALRPELHASYRYLCAPSNPISSELFGDDLPKAVKDITDTNRITSKLQRDKKESYRRGRQPERLDKFQRKRNYSGAKKLPSPLPTQGGREEESPEAPALNPKSTQHPNSEVSAAHDVCIKVAGRLKCFLSEWKLITTDPKILDMVQHCHLEFTELPSQHYNLPPVGFNTRGAKIIDDEIKTLLNKGVIEEAQPSQHQVISSIFLRKKKNGSYRMILNLKGLNEFIEYKHFKMESVAFAVQLMSKNCYMASMTVWMGLTDN